MAEVVVIGFDGSPDAEHAIDVAARALRADSALVVTAWHLPIAPAGTPVVPGGAAPPVHDAEAFERHGMELASTGAARARAAGLEAEAVVQRAAGASEIAHRLFDIAEERDASLVVVGRRGMSRLRSVLLGSVSEAALHDCRRPLLVVPSAAGHGDEH